MLIYVLELFDRGGGWSPPWIRHWIPLINARKDYIHSTSKLSGWKYCVSQLQLDKARMKFHAFQSIYICIYFSNILVFFLTFLLQLFFFFLSLQGSNMPVSCFIDESWYVTPRKRSVVLFRFSRGRCFIHHLVDKLS